MTLNRTAFTYRVARYEETVAQTKRHSF